MEGSATLKVGYIVPFLILKAMPDYDSYFTNIVGTEIYAILPKKYSDKIYKVGDTGWACVFQIMRPRVVLSQRSPQFARKIIESMLADTLNRNEISIKKAARIEKGDFFKVAVWSPNIDKMTSKDIYKLLINDIPKVAPYISQRLFFVKYSKDIKQYIINALEPAPPEKIRKVIYYSDEQQATVYIDSADVGLFMGRYKANLLTAIKLTSTVIELKGV